MFLFVTFQMLNTQVEEFLDSIGSGRTSGPGLRIWN